MKLFGISEIHRSMPVTQPVPAGPAAFAATVVKQLPIQTFSGDILVGASSDVTIDATLAFSDRCTGIVFQSAAGTVQVSINGSAFRTLVSDQAINDAAIQNIRVRTGLLSSVIVQLHGV